MRPFANVQLLGVVLQWIVALVLCGVFLLLRGDGTARRTLLLWAGAWFAHAVGTAGFALEAIALMLGVAPPAAVVHLVWGYWPAVFGFPVLVLMGAVCLLEGRAPSRRAASIGLGVLGAAALLPVLGVLDLASRLRDITAPVILFGTALVVLGRAGGERQRGLVFLGAALALYATVSTLNVLAVLGIPSFPDQALASLQLTAGFGEAAALVVLASAVVVMVVQDSLLDADRARQDRMRQVAASEARLTAIIAAAGEAIVTVDGAERVELVNAAAERVFGAPARALVGRPLADLLPADDRGCREDGTVFPVAVTRGAIADRPGGGSVVLVRDLTEQLALASERERLERHLAQSERMMAIGRIASGVAHELNNPLSVVLGQSEQLVADVPEGDLRTGLRLITEQAVRARHIVKDLLAFVRPREDRRETFALEPVLRRAMASVAPQVAERGVALVTDLPDATLHVHADAVAVEQVLVNLLDNALDALGGSGRVRLAARDAGEWVEVVVEDSGPGVPEESVGRLFEPFFTSKPVGEGTGLGLPVSLGLIEQQGGTLVFENRPAHGVGARVVVRLRAGVPVPRGAATPRVAIFPPAPRLPDGTAAEVLLVDDEAAVRATLARMFRRNGWRVREAGSGDEALGILLQADASALPAVIFCDLKMPGISGQQVHEALRAARPELLARFAFVTGDVVGESAASFLAGSGCPVLEKPFTIAEAAVVVERLVGTD